MFRSFKEALYHSCEHGFLEIAMELRSLGKNELCITSKSVFRMSIIKAKKTSKKIYLKGQGDRVIQSEDNENMNLGVDIPRGGSSCPLFPGQVDFGNVKIFWRVGNRRTYIYITKSTYFLHLSCSGVPWNIHCWSQTVGHAYERGQKAFLKCLLRDFQSMPINEYTSDFCEDGLVILFNIFKECEVT